MSSYTAPLRDLRFNISELVGLRDIAALPGFEDISVDLVDAILEQAGQLAEDVIAPLNHIGDIEGSRLENGVVRTPTGWRDAYERFAAGGWNAVPFNPDHGGQGLPWLVATAIMEIWMGANTSFALCPMLSQGAAEAIDVHASQALKDIYLGKLISGQWTGTMNLTEPQAGTDLSLLRTRAVPDGDGYRISGQKIFITYGDHDLAENIVHLVLARTPDAPQGVSGLSLFLVPKFIPDVDGRPGEANDVRCISLERKLGIHASPTCAMEFGGNEGALGWLIGEENKGLACMFTMMNSARLAVGLHGPALAERAYQRAVAYAKTRVQGTPAGGGASTTIIHHADVRRMLLSMRTRAEAMRALAIYSASELDLAHRHPDEETRRAHQKTVDLLIPVVKGWSTDTGFEVTSTGIQVHGGMGYIEETGAAQHLRDARIAMIYEGTNGIQAADLVGRKIGHDGGHAARAFIDRMAHVLDDLAATPALAAIHDGLKEGLTALSEAIEYIVARAVEMPEDAHAASSPFLELFGIVAGGWRLAHSALIAQTALAAGDGEDSFYSAKIITARFFAEHYLSRAAGLAATVHSGGATVMALTEDQF